MFYNAGFMILLPLVFSTAQESGLPLTRVAIPVASSLSVTHGFLPPHPGPLALASIFHADIGLTLLYGIVIAVPTVIVAGPLFSRTLKNVSAAPPAGLFDGPKISSDELPPTSMSFVLALTPVVLITVAALLGIWFDRSSTVILFFDFLGEPTIAFLLSVFLAVHFLHLRRGRHMQEVMASLGNSVNTVASILLIIAAGGALKQIIIDAGVGNAISELGRGIQLSPVFVGWLVAALMRVALGSATVAGLTAAGIVLPIVQGSNVRPELMVLALGAGSLMFSHVNDTGFWMFKEFFNLSVKHTFRSWSIMETIVSVLGLLGVLILSVLWP
jgi:gluconate transporter